MEQEKTEYIPVREYWLLWTVLYLPGLLQAPLLSTASEPIKILDPGKRNYDNGPDLLGSTIEINHLRQRGDIEFHICPQDWFRHGHHEDRRYENVILHILWHSPAPIPATLSGRFPHLILSENLTVPPGAWREQMLSLEKNESPGPTGNSALDLLSRQTLVKLARERFNKKVDRFSAWLQNHSFDDVLFMALGEVMGYSKNKMPFRILMEEVPPSILHRFIPLWQRSPLSIWVFLAIKANFLSNQLLNSSGREREDEMVRRLFRQFSGQGHYPILQLKDWYFSRIRPGNSPVIRLAGLSQIIFRYHSPSLFEEILTLARNRSPLKELLAAWQQRLQLRIQPQLINAIKRIYGIRHVPERTLGKTRFRQFIVNGLLPLLSLWAEHSGNFGFQQYIGWLYEEFPAIEEKYLIEKLLRDCPAAKLRCLINKSGFYQQGLLEFLLTAESSKVKPGDFLPFREPPAYI